MSNFGKNLLFHWLSYRTFEPMCRDATKNNYANNVELEQIHLSHGINRRTTELLKKILANFEIVK